MTRDPKTLSATMPIADVLQFFAEQAEHRSYPVVDGEGRLLGLVSRTEALRWEVSKTAEGELGDLLSDASTRCAYPDTPCGRIADMMVESGVGRVPIVDPATRRVVEVRPIARENAGGTHGGPALAAASRARSKRGSRAARRPMKKAAPSIPRAVQFFEQLAGLLEVPRLTGMIEAQGRAF